MGPQLIHGDHTRHKAPTAEQTNVMTRFRSHSRLFPVCIELYTWKVFFSYPLKHVFQYLSVVATVTTGTKTCSETVNASPRQIHNEIIEFCQIMVDGLGSAQRYKERILRSASYRINSSSLFALYGSACRLNIFDVNTEPVTRNATQLFLTIVNY